MISRFAINEIKKDIKLLIPVIIQLSCALILIIACVSSVTSRFKYYTPFRNIIEQNGCVAVINSVSNYSSDELKEKLHNCRDIYMQYYLVSDADVTAPIVYDDFIMESYPLEMLSGEWVVSCNDREYPQVIVSENTGYNVGDIIVTDLDCKFEVAGIFKNSQKMICFNNMAADYCDYRLMYAENDIDTKYMILSRSEAEKSNGVCYPNGLTFIVYNSNINNDEIIANSVILSENGMVGSFNNTELTSNSKAYIYEQFYTLLPILLCVMLLLFVSIVSVNSISTVKRLKYYAIYRMCGLSCNKCTSISSFKSIYLSIISLIVCYILFIIKSKFSFFDTFIMDIGSIQIICCIIFLALNVIVSYIVCNFIIRRNELNHIIKEN